MELKVTSFSKEKFLQENISYVIEGNHNPDLDLIQIFKVYLTEEKSIKLFKEFGVYE